MKSLEERAKAHVRPIGCIARGIVVQVDNPAKRHLVLRLDAEGRSEETERGNQEHPPTDHWITSSARWSIDGGIVSPSALAVLRLMTSRYRDGCSIGRSAGLAPFRILSTYMAARLYKSA